MQKITSSELNRSNHTGKTALQSSSYVMRLPLLMISLINPMDDAKKMNKFLTGQLKRNSLICCYHILLALTKTEFKFKRGNYLVECDEQEPEQCLSPHQKYSWVNYV